MCKGWVRYLGGICILIVLYQMFCMQLRSIDKALQKIEDSLQQQVFEDGPEEMLIKAAELRAERAALLFQHLSSSQ
jgi:hypothetical protein